jgi:DNA-binding response OmpR family regulator
MAKQREVRPVLIIEDEADIRNFASRVLELEGYKVLEASDGKRGMEIMREHTVALVLLDLRLPGRDGWSVLNEIKHDAVLSKIPVIVITAVADALQKRRTLHMGATRYLIKPMSAHSLAKTITSILHKKGESQTTQKSNTPEN